MPEVTPIYVRDKLVECFIRTNKIFVKEQAKKQMKNISDTDIERQLLLDVKRAFELLRRTSQTPEGKASRK